MGNTNYIKAEINISERDINKNIRIINSFENYKKENEIKDKETDNIYANEEEIKRCKIKINEKLIDFSYYYKFNQKGKYNIKYLLPRKLTNMNCMFNGCNSITNIDLSNINTKNVTNMSYMFYGCDYLKNIDLSNFNTENVINMSYMFYGCNSINNIDLSNFNTQNVNNMSYSSLVVII